MNDTYLLARLFKDLGTDIIFDANVVSYLSDYGIFNKTPYHKAILKAIIHEGCFKELISNISIRSMFLQKFLYRTGFDESKVSALLDIILDAISLALSSCVDTKATHDDFSTAKSIGYCKYSEDGTKLLECSCRKYSSDPITISIVPGTKIICDYAFKNANIDKLIIPSSVEVIGYNALPNCYIGCDSPSFIIDDNVLYTNDKTRIIKNISNESVIFDIHDTVVSIDSEAFYERCTWRYDNPPYFFRIHSTVVDPFNYEYATLIIETEEAKSILCNKSVPETILNKIYPETQKKHNQRNIEKTKNGFNEDDFIIGDVFVDEFGVVYTSDKKTLLCFPKEYKLVSYEIIPECVAIGRDAFNWLTDPDDDGYLYIIGNKIEILKLPLKLQAIEPYGLQGLVNLKTILYNKSEEKNVLRILDEYSDYKVDTLRKKCHLIPY